MRLIDSHAHLDDRAFGKDRAAVIARAFAEDIGIVTIGSDLRSSREAVRLAERHRRIWATVGVHPHDAKRVDARTLGELEALAEQAVAIGEIGLDYYRDLSPRDVQRRAFREQLELARGVDLPICLHNRESTDDLLAILREAGDAHRGVVHSFLGEAVKVVSLERLLVETDSPYLTPVPYRGRRNEPSYVAYVAEEIARLKGLDPEDVARRTTENAARLFELKL